VSVLDDLRKIAATWRTSTIERFNEGAAVLEDVIAKHEHPVAALPDTRPRLTAQQQRVLDFICDFRLARGVSPSYREIAEHFGWTSTNGVHDHLRALETKGYLERPGVCRSLRPIL